MEDDKKHGRFASVMVPIIVAVISVVGVLGAAMFSNWDKLFPQKPPTQIFPGSNAAAASATGSGASPSRPLVTPLRTKGPLFIVAPPGPEGASIGARILIELQVEGFQIANSPDGAKLLVELQAPDLGPLQASPVGGLDGFSVIATLTAKMFPRSDGSRNTIPMQRQALGMGATEVEARRNSIAAATDRLGKSIVETLR